MYADKSHASYIALRVSKRFSVTRMKASISSLISGTFCIALHIKLESADDARVCDHVKLFQKIHTSKCPNGSRIFLAEFYTFESSNIDTVQHIDFQRRSV